MQSEIQHVEPSVVNEIVVGVYQTLTSNNLSRTWCPAKLKTLSEQGVATICEKIGIETKGKSVEEIHAEIVSHNPLTTNDVDSAEALRNGLLGMRVLTGGEFSEEDVKAVIQGNPEKFEKIAAQFGISPETPIQDAVQEMVGKPKSLFPKRAVEATQAKIREARFRMNYWPKKQESSDEDSTPEDA